MYKGPVNPLEPFHMLLHPVAYPVSLSQGETSISLLACRRTRMGIR